MGKLIKKKTIQEGKFLRFVDIAYRDSKGTERTWEAFERVDCDGIVAIVPVTDEREVLLIKQFRPPVNAYVIEFPAGLNDREETIEEAAERELLEETGYIARELIFLTKGPLSSGASSEVLTVFLAKGLEFKGLVRGDETENIEVIKVTVNDFDKKLHLLEEEGNLIDLKVYGLMELARRHL